MIHLPGMIGEFSGNTDTYWSVYQYKKRGKDKIYTGPVWDFDIAFDNDYRTYPLNNKSDFVCFSGGSHAGDMKNFVYRIVIQDTKTMGQLRQLWGEGRCNGITPEALCSWIDDMALLMDRSQTLNFMRWDILNSNQHMNPVSRGSYQKEVEYLKEYISKRIEWMDKRLNYVYTDLTDIQVSDNQIYVWDLLGRCLYQGTEMPTLQTGTYIIRANGVTETKIITK